MMDTSHATSFTGARPQPLLRPNRSDVSIDQGPEAGFQPKRTAPYLNVASQGLWLSPTGRQDALFKLYDPGVVLMVCSA